MSKPSQPSPKQKERNKGFMDRTAQDEALQNEIEELRANLNRVRGELVQLRNDYSLRQFVCDELLKASRLGLASMVALQARAFHKGEMIIAEECRIQAEQIRYAISMAKE